MKYGYYLFVLIAVSLIFININSCTYQKETSFVALCDTTTNNKFTANVVPILTNYCSNCHGSPTGQAYSYFKLDVFKANPTIAMAQAVLNAITAKGVTLMPPKERGKLSTCNINTIKAWFNRGALNN